MEKWEKNHHFGENSNCVLSTGTGTGTGTHCSVLTSVRILAITW